MDAILFLIFAAIAVVCAINLVLQKHPISSALSLVGVMGSLAVLYLLLGGEFIAMAQLIVYAGAIMVLFVFVIMLLNAGVERKDPAPSVGDLCRRSAAGRHDRHCVLHHPARAPAYSPASASERSRTATPHEIGLKLFEDYLLPFEVTSILILIAHDRGHRARTEGDQLMPQIPAKRSALLVPDSERDPVRPRAWPDSCSAATLLLCSCPSS